MFEDWKFVSDVFKLDGNFLARFKIGPLSQSVSSAFSRDSLTTSVDNTAASSSYFAFNPIFVLNENILGELEYCLRL